MQAFLDWTKLVVTKIAAAMLLIGVAINFFPDGPAMSASREQIQLICETNGIKDTDTFCNAVAKSLSAASNSAASVVTEGKFAGDGLAVRLEFTVKGKAGRALVETGVVMNGKFIARTSETSGIHTMDATVETGAVQLLANMMASRLNQN